MKEYLKIIDEIIALVGLHLISNNHKDIYKMKTSSK